MGIFNSLLGLINKRMMDDEKKTKQERNGATDCWLSKAITPVSFNP